MKVRSPVGVPRPPPRILAKSRAACRDKAAREPLATRLLWVEEERRPFLGTCAAEEDAEADADMDEGPEAFEEVAPRGGREEVEACIPLNCSESSASVSEGGLRAPLPSDVEPSRFEMFVSMSMWLGPRAREREVRATAASVAFEAASAEVVELEANVEGCCKLCVPALPEEGPPLLGLEESS